MTLTSVIRIISDCIDDVCFVVDDRKAGVTSTVKNSKPTYQAWYGDRIRYYKSVDDVVNDPFYGGKTIADLVELVDFDIE